ncbi:MAG: TonB-dependent receptor [Bacteroidaceae bacterium]|nr:TonB-dependent receptor [Bacteroidaceae bacterium]
MRQGVLMFLTFVLSLGLRAQDRVLKEVEIAASRRMKDTGLEQTVLDTTVLHQNLAYSMADILQGNTTLFIKSYGRATESTAEFRGTSPSHTQVTWNGMKINSPMLGTVDFSYIPGHFVDQATLLHGASSINLTGGGLGGAIELTTQPEWGRGFGAQFTQGVGSYGTFDEFLKFTFSNERWSSSTRLSYGHSKNDFSYTNYDKKVDVRDESGSIVKSYHPTERNQSGYFDDVNAMQDVVYRDGKGNRLGATVWYGYSLRGLPFLSVDYKDNSDFTNEHRQQNVRSVLSWRHTRSTWMLDVKGGYLYQDIDYNYFTQREQISNEITHSRSYTQTAYLQANFDCFPSQRLQFCASASGYYNHVRSWDRSPFHIGDNYNLGRAEESLALSAKWRPLNPLTFNIVAREEVYGQRFVPLIPAIFADVVLYRPWNLVLKGSVARNYRYPSMDDLYFQPGGNPSLQPERGFTYDGGIELNVKKKRHSIQGSITAFDSHISDWILWTPNQKGYWMPSNVKKVHNYGVEAHAESHITISPDWHLTLSANYAYTPSINRGEQVNTNDASYGKQLCYVPLVSANANARLQWRQWTLTYQWIHYGRRYTTTSNEVEHITGELKPYYMSNASLERNFQLRRLRLSAKAVVNNLLNNHYVTVLSHPMAGINGELFFEIRY